MAFFGPTARVSATIGVVQNRPIFTPGVAKRASAAATARSHEATSWQPAAVAIPCTSAMTGCGIDWIVSMTSAQVEKSCWKNASSRPIISLRSCPALNAGPLARTTATRSSRSAPMARKDSSNSCRCSSESALRRSGRSIVTNAIGPSRSTEMLRNRATMSVLLLPRNGSHDVRSGRSIAPP